jgi:predicted Fe-Mo cluster-binding NifX family protein
MNFEKVEETKMKRLASIMVMLQVLMLWVGSVVFAAGDIEFAVAAEGQTVTAQVSQQAARGSYFLFFNKQGELMEAVANPYQQATGGAGTRVAEFLAEKGVRTFLAGEFGAKMTRALKEKGIVASVAVGNAQDAVQAVIH